MGSENYHIKSEFDQTYNLSNRVNILSRSGYYNSIYNYRVVSVCSSTVFEIIL